MITLVSIINGAAFNEGHDVKSSELHGLSQRGGSVETHVRFGKRVCPVGSRSVSCGVFSPLISGGEADLIIGLEILEGLRATKYAGPKTKFLINEYSLPFIGSLNKEKIKKNLKKIAKNKLYLVPASDICQKELNNEVVSGIYLLGYAVFKKLISLKPESIVKGIEKNIPAKYLELNKKAFNLAKNK